MREFIPDFDNTNRKKNYFLMSVLLLGISSL